MNKDTHRKIVSESVVVTKEEHVCYGCSRKFPKGSSMSSANCKINGFTERKYFCEACHHYMVKNNFGIDKFYFGELLQQALTYEKSKNNN